MPPTLRALLIASPYGGLRGPENDIKSMAGVLTKYGFDVTECCGAEATRAKILDCWRNLIDSSSAGDVVVIYYSGHGGIVESSEDSHSQQGGSVDSPPSQFLVPMDLDKSTDDDFRGIMDIEMSYLLRDTTNKTKNVTVILDCCHSGRMARDPRHINRAWLRNLPPFKHAALRNHEDRLRHKGHFTGDTSIEGNVHALTSVAFRCGRNPNSLIAFCELCQEPI